MSDGQAVIEQRENGPLVVKNLSDLRLADGTAAEAKPVMALCRCGGSQNKPFCDGTHAQIGFDSTAATDISERDSVQVYAGKDFTIFYNSLLCSHAGECGKGAQKVFDLGQDPWIQPDNGTEDEIATVMAACPSGALRYARTGGEPRLVAGDHVYITIEKNGPYRVHNIPIDAEFRAEGGSASKYVLCRCGKSANKPFCDGAHSDAGWTDDT